MVVTMADAPREWVEEAGQGGAVGRSVHGRGPVGRRAVDAEARGGRLPSGHVDRLRRPAAYAAVARCPAQGDGVAPGHEPIERDATCSANGLTAPAGHADRVAARDRKSVV